MTLASGPLQKPTIAVKSVHSPGKLSLGGVLLVLGSVALSLILGETALRLGGYDEKGKVHLNSFTEYDPTLGWRTRRNPSTEFVTSEYKTTLQYGPTGLRGPVQGTPGYAKSANVSRIVVLGDSFVDGFTVPLQDRVTEVMTGLLPNYEVINLGVSGYSTDQELLMLEQEGWKYQPDLVVLFFYFNDIWMNGDRILSGATEKPFFNIDENGDLVLKNVPVPRPVPALEERSKLYALVRTAIKSRPWLYTRASSALGHRTPPPLTSPMPAGAGGTADQFKVYKKTETPELKIRWTITQALLRRMNQESQQRGSRFVVFYVPTRIELSSIEWDSDHIPPEFDPRQVSMKIARICGEEQIPFIDPSSRFREATMQGPLYYKHDVHWNSAGHHLAAKILAEYVRNSQ
jgi:lysophospholipase L1-like esterase